jgi:RNA polymerase sigma factor FliA
MTSANHEVQSCWERWHTYQDIEARKALVVHYLYLVGYAVKRMAHHLSPRAEAADLNHAGVLGLMDAVEKFEANRNIKFETYASFRIQGAILDHLRSLDWMPRTLRKQARQLAAAYEALESLHGRPPTDLQLAHYLEVSVEQVRRWRTQASELSLQSLEESFVGHDLQEISLRDALEDTREAPEHTLLESAVTETLADAISSLPEREQLVLSLHYFEELTLKEVGLILNLSEARISQLHALCLSRLRERLRPYVGVR